MKTRRSLFRSQSERVVGSSEKVVVVKMVPISELDDLTLPLPNETNKPKRHESLSAADISNKKADFVAMKANKRSSSKFKLHIAHLLGSSGSNTNTNSGKTLSAKNLSNYDSDLGDSCNSSEVDGSMPVLLAVRKRSCSDSGHESATSATDSPSPRSGPRLTSTTTSHHKPTTTKKTGLFRLFHRSATLLFNHPTTELNPSKPYKGTISTSAKNVNRHYHHHASKGHLREHRHRISASSSSSLNSYVLHHHLEHDEGDGEVGRPVISLPPASVSSSNSVISDIDSGAFSRTSTPESAPHLASQPRPLTNAKSTLALAPPLCAPALVLEVTGRHFRRGRSTFDLSSTLEPYSLATDKVDATHILACLNAASESSSLYPHYYGIFKPEDYYKLNSRHDVSVTIGQNTKLTIAPSSLPSFLSAATGLRRSRSGLPLLGTAGLKKTSDSSSPVKGSSTPVKPNRLNSPQTKTAASSSSRSRISTVYVGTTPTKSKTRSTSPVKRSESFVTLSNTNSANRSVVSCCNEKVTVNGQHHCCHMSSQEDNTSQPSSLINV